MALKLIYGRAGSGTSDYIRKEAQANAGLLIVPETHTLSTEQYFASFGTLGLGGVEVLSFLRLAHANSDYGPLASSSIDPVGKNMALAAITEQIRNDLTILKGFSKHNGFSSEILKFIRECKRYGVTAEALAEASEKANQPSLAEKLHDLSLLYQKYCDFIADGYTDRDDDLIRLQNTLEQEAPYAGRFIYMDKFSSFTPLEYSVIESLLRQCQLLSIALPCEKEGFEFQFRSARETAERLIALAERSGIPYEELTFSGHPEENELTHLEKNYFSFTPIRYDHPVRRLSEFSAKDMKSETEYAARKILSLVRDSARFSDIAVIVRDTGSYDSVVKSVFDAHGIPFTNTERRTASEHALVVYVLSFLDTLTSGFALDPLLRYLKNGFCGISKSDADVFENYLLATGIKGSQFYRDERWNYRTEIFSQRMFSEKDEAFFDRINRIRDDIVSPFIALKKALSGTVSAEEFCRAIYGFFEETELKSKIETLYQRHISADRADDAAELIGVYNGIISSMDSLIACCGTQMLTAKNFTHIFSEGLSAVTMSLIPSSVDSVHFLNASRAKGMTFPYVFILGLNNGIFPAIPESQSVLTDSDRRLLKDELNIELAPDSIGLNYEELSLLYGTLTSAQKELYLSYPLKSEGLATLLPSPVIKKVEEIFPGIPRYTDTCLPLSSEEKAETPALSDAEKTEVVSPESSDDTGRQPLTPEDYISAPMPTLTHMLSALNQAADNNKQSDVVWREVYGWFREKDEYFLPHIPDSFSKMRYAAPLSETIISSVFPDGFKTSVSRLETFASCPFRYYMQYTLGARPRSEADFTRSDTGSILHFYMEALSRYIENHALTWQTITDEEIRRVASETTKAILENGSYYLKNSKRALYHLKRLETLSYKMLLLVKTQFEIGSFEPLGCEINFKHGGEYPSIPVKTPRGTVYLTGKIDRADVCHTDRGDFVRIVDYKSGNKTFSLPDVYHGLSLQLSIYMLALNQNTNSKPAGIMYMHLADEILNVDSTDEAEIEKERIKNLKANGLFLDDPAILYAMDNKNGENSPYFDFKSRATLQNFNDLFMHVRSVVSSLVDEMKKGTTAIDPKGIDKAPCEYCDYRSVCLSSSSCCQKEKIDGQNFWQAISTAKEGESR